MKAPRKLLLGHHGTSGARAAEKLAHEFAVPGITTIVHCLVVPEFWAGMQGDDWLNNASTRDTFGRYLEGMLEGDAKRELASVALRCKEHGFGYESVMRFGNPAETMLAVAGETGAEFVVIGSPRHKGEEGLRSRMELEKLVNGLACPLLIAPHP